MISAVAGPASSVNKPPNRMWHFRLLMRQLGQPRGSSVIPKGLAGDSALLPGSNQQGHGGSWQGLAFDISWVGTVTRNGCHFAPRRRAFRGRAVVVMTRRPAAIAKCDRPTIFQAGRTRAVGAAWRHPVYGDRRPRGDHTPPSVARALVLVAPAALLSGLGAWWALTLPARAGTGSVLVRPDLATPGLHLAAHLLGLQPPAFLRPGHPRRHPSLRRLQRPGDEFRESFSGDFAIACLAPGFADLNQQGPVRGPATSREPLQPPLDRLGKRRRPRGLEPQLHRRRDLVDVLTPGPRGADELLGDFPVLDGEGVGYAERHFGIS